MTTRTVRSTRTDAPNAMSSKDLSTLAHIAGSVHTISARVTGMLATDLAVQQMLQGALEVGSLRQWRAKPISPDETVLKYFLQFSTGNPITLDVEVFPL